MKYTHEIQILMNVKFFTHRSWYLFIFEIFDKATLHV